MNNKPAYIIIPGYKRKSNKLLIFCCLVFLFLLIYAAIENEINPIEPQQVHLSYGEKVEDIRFTWSTIEEDESIVIIKKLEEREWRRYTGGKKKFKSSLIHSQYIYKVECINLIAGKMILMLK